MGRQINITRREFEVSCRYHYSLYKKTLHQIAPRSRRLLLFYSVECGLKSLILKNIGKNTYEELKTYSEKKQMNIHGHDLKEMTRVVGIEHKYPLKKIRLTNRGGDVPPDRYNELWRYGASTEDETEEIREEQTLVGIADWIEQRL